MQPFPSGKIHAVTGYTLPNLLWSLAEQVSVAHQEFEPSAMTSNHAAATTNPPLGSKVITTQPNYLHALLLTEQNH